MVLEKKHVMHACQCKLLSGKWGDRETWAEREDKYVYPVSTWIEWHCYGLWGSMLNCICICWLLLLTGFQLSSISFHLNLKQHFFYLSKSCPIYHHILMPATIWYFLQLFYSWSWHGIFNFGEAVAVWDRICSCIPTWKNGYLLCSTFSVHDLSENCKDEMWGWPRWKLQR